MQIIVEIAQGPERALRLGIIKPSDYAAHQAYATIVQHTCYIILLQMGYSPREINEMFTIKEDT